MPPFPLRSSLVPTMLYRPAPNLPRLTLPLFGCPVRAGFPSPATDYVAEHLDLNEHLIAHKEATFFLRAKGHSMVGAGTQDGDLLVVDRSLTPTHRSVVIAVVDGEFTCKRLYTGQTQQPYYFSDRSGAPLALAGLWESWKALDGSIVRTTCIITTAANALMAPVHDRMPVIVGATDWQRWLASPPAEVADLIRPYAGTDLQAWPVGRRVSRTGEDDERLIAPLPPMLEVFR